MKPESEEQLLFAFFNEIGIIAQLGRAQFERVLPHGLKISQFSVLNHFVRLERDSTPARLARNFQVTKGAMTNTLGRLHALGFVDISPDPRDGRGKRVRITCAGRAAHAACVQSITPGLTELASTFAPEQFRAALPLLQSLRAYLDGARDRFDD
ncbi:MAG: MarR family transcriptional regulator [Pseudomonadota bacterium]